MFQFKSPLKAQLQMLYSMISFFSMFGGVRLCYELITIHRQVCVVNLLLPLILRGSVIVPRTRKI